MKTEIPLSVVHSAVECVTSGGVLLHPTDTVYGIGGDAENDATSSRIRDLKGTDASKPLLVLTDRWERVESWIGDADAKSRALMTVGLEYPLTILFRATERVPRGLIGSSDEVGIRLCLHPFCAGVIQRSGRLLSSTSANRTTAPIPASFEDIDPHIRAGSDFVVDGGTLSGAASTIVRCVDGRLEIVREGSLPTTVLSHLIG